MRRGVSRSSWRNLRSDVHAPWEWTPSSLKRDISISREFSIDTFMSYNSHLISRRYKIWDYILFWYDDFCNKYLIITFFYIILFIAHWNIKELCNTQYLEKWLMMKICIKKNLKKSIWYPSIDPGKINQSTCYLWNYSFLTNAFINEVFLVLIKGEKGEYKKEKRSSIDCTVPTSYNAIGCRTTLRASWLGIVTDLDLCSDIPVRALYH